MKYKRTGFIIQARLGASRLPNKIILPFYRGQSIIEILIERFKELYSDIPFIIATSTNKTDDKLTDILLNLRVKVYRGSENNVLDRFIEAAKFHNFDNIIRICADNPFLDIKGTIGLLEQHLENLNDYTGYKVNGDIPSIKSHLGLWGEIVSLEALKKVKGFTEKQIYHEHVTNFIYENINKFKVKLIDAPEIVFNRNDIRLTVDTKEDFDVSKEIYAKLADSNKTLELNNIIKIIDKNPKYLETMKSQIKLNSK